MIAIWLVLLGPRNQAWNQHCLPVWPACKERRVGVGWSRRDDSLVASPPRQLAQSAKRMEILPRVLLVPFANVQVPPSSELILINFGKNNKFY